MFTFWKMIMLITLADGSTIGVDTRFEDEAQCHQVYEVLVAGENTGATPCEAITVYRGEFD